MPCLGISAAWETTMDANNIFEIFLKYDTRIIHFAVGSLQVCECVSPLTIPTYLGPKISCPRTREVPLRPKARVPLLPLKMGHCRKLLMVSPGHCSPSTPAPSCRYPPPHLLPIEPSSNLWPWVRMGMPAEIGRIQRVFRSIDRVHGQHVQVGRHGRVQRWVDGVHGQLFWGRLRFLRLVF